MMHIDSFRGRKGRLSEQPFGQQQRTRAQCRETTGETVAVEIAAAIDGVIQVLPGRIASHEILQR